MSVASGMNLASWNANSKSSDSRNAPIENVGVVCKGRHDVLFQPNKCTLCNNLNARAEFLMKVNNISYDVISLDHFRMLTQGQLEKWNNNWSHQTVDDGLFCIVIRIKSNTICQHFSGFQFRKSDTSFAYLQLRANKRCLYYNSHTKFDLTHLHSKMQYHFHRLGIDFIL